MKKIIATLIIGIIIGSTSTFAASKLFSDVEQGQWYSDAVYNLVEKGIIEGYDDATFKPSNGVNRAELAVMLDRLLTHLENKNVRLGVLTEVGALAVMQSYDECIPNGIAPEDIKLDLKDITGGLYWIAEIQDYYCKLNALTAEMEEYYQLPE